MWVMAGSGLTGWTRRKREPSRVMLKLVFPVIVGVSLLKWPRSGVLLVHAAFATLVLGEAIGWLHMAAFWRKWPEFGISWQPAAFWLLALAVTLPFWSKTPWSMERDQP